MTHNNRKMLNEAVRILKHWHFNMNDVFLCGSLALDLHGVLPKNREVSDVDLIIRMNHKTWGCVKLLAEIFKNEDGHGAYNDESQVYFTVNGVNFNIWYADEYYPSDKYAMKDAVTGVWVKSVKDILDVKRKYGRAKDFKDINNICKELLG